MLFLHRYRPRSVMARLFFVSFHVVVLPVRFMCPPIGTRRPNRAQAAADEAADRLAASGALTAVASSAQLAALNAAARAGLRAAAAPPTEVPYCRVKV